jgi:hypothetical protein
MFTVPSTLFLLIAAPSGASDSKLARTITLSPSVSRRIYAEICAGNSGQSQQEDVEFGHLCFCPFRRMSLGDLLLRRKVSSESANAIVGREGLGNGKQLHELGSLNRSRFDASLLLQPI